MTALEYALIAAMIFLGIITAVSNYATGVPMLYRTVVNAFANVGL